VLDYAREELKYDLPWREQEILIRGGIVKNYREANDWMSLNPEAFDKRVEEKLEAYMKKLEDALEGKEYLVMVEYGDDGGPFWSILEHEIVPELDCCKARFSHH